MCVCGKVVLSDTPSQVFLVDGAIWANKFLKYIISTEQHGAITLPLKWVIIVRSPPSFPNHKYAFALELKIKIISLLSLFLLLFMEPTVLFDTIHEPTVLFQLTFTFIYNIFNNNFLISIK